MGAFFSETKRVHGTKRVQGTIQNASLRIATGHTKDTNKYHLHTESKVLPIE